MMQNRRYEKESEYEKAARVSDETLRRARIFTRIPPNLVTLSSGVLVIPMIMTFREHAMLVGAILFSIRGVMDWLDGALARYQLRLSREGRLDLQLHRKAWRRLGPTEFGHKIDPFNDKIGYYGALFPLGWQALPHALIWVSIGFAAGLTLLRLLTKWLLGIELPSNRWGKHKVHVEILTVALLVFSASGLPLGIFVLPTFAAAAFLGGASLLTQGAEAFRRRHERPVHQGLPRAIICKLRRKTRTS